MAQYKISGNLAVSENGFLFMPNTGESFTVNETGREIISLLKEGLSEEEIITRMTEKYDGNGLFDEDETRSEYEKYYGKKIQTKQGIFTIVRIGSIGNELRIYFQEDQDGGYATLPDVETLEKAISRLEQ